MTNKEPYSPIGHHTFFRSCAPKLSASFLGYRSKIGCAFSCHLAQWTKAASLPAYNDRIVQVAHLIPFYSRIVGHSPSNLQGTENRRYSIAHHYKPFSPNFRQIPLYSPRLSAGIKKSHRLCKLCVIPSFPNYVCTRSALLAAEAADIPPHRSWAIQLRPAECPVCPSYIFCGSASAARFPGTGF